MKKTSLLGAALIVAGTLGGGSAAVAGTHAGSYDSRFADKTQERLRELAISADDVREVTIAPYRRRTSGGGGPENLGMEAWVKLNSCSGSLNIFMDRKAFVRETYTLGDCEIEGVKRY